MLSKQEEYVSKDKVSTRKFAACKAKWRPDAWIFRWYEDQPNGRKQYRKTVVGTVVQFPTEIVHPMSVYQLLVISDGRSPARVALEKDVQPESTPQFGGKPLPLALTPQASQHGRFFLIREGLRYYPNKVLHAWIAHWIYEDVPPYKLFTWQYIFGLIAFGLQLPFSIGKDIRRIKDLRYGRRLKGPILVSGKQFTRAVAGTGIGITTNDSRLPLRIPRDAENKHFLIVGHWFRLVEHHPPDAIPGRSAWGQRHRI